MSRNLLKAIRLFKPSAKPEATPTNSPNRWVPVVDPLEAAQQEAVPAVPSETAHSVAAARTTGPARVEPSILPTPPASPFEAIRLLDPFTEGKTSKRAKHGKPFRSTDSTSTASAQPAPAFQNVPASSRHSSPFDSVRLLDPFEKTKAPSAAPREEKTEPRSDSERTGASTALAA